MRILIIWLRIILGGGLIWGAVYFGLTPLGVIFAVAALVYNLTTIRAAV